MGGPTCDSWEEGLYACKEGGLSQPSFKGLIRRWCVHSPDRQVISPGGKEGLLPSFPSGLMTYLSALLPPHSNRVTVLPPSSTSHVMGLPPLTHLSWACLHSHTCHGPASSHTPVMGLPPRWSHVVCCALLPLMSLRALHTLHPAFTPPPTPS